MVATDPLFALGLGLAATTGPERRKLEVVIAELGASLLFRDVGIHR